MFATLSYPPRTRAALPALCLALWLIVGATAGAQTVPDTTASAHAETRPSATLKPWRDGLRRYEYDRNHSERGIYFDRGLYRRSTFQMDHEYLLDKQTIAFSMAEDAIWASPGAHVGYRGASGSADIGHLASEHEFRARMPLSGPFTFVGSAWLQDDQQAQRGVAYVGFDYALTPSNPERHKLTFRQTFASFKADLDFSLGYAHRDAAGNELAASITSLDVISDLVFEVIGVDPVHADTIRAYASPPVALEWMASSAPRLVGSVPVRGEISGSWAPTTDARIDIRSRPDGPFRFELGYATLGLLAEAQLPFATVGARFVSASSRIERGLVSGSTSSSSYNSIQSDLAGGVFGLARHGDWRAEILAERGRYTDIQSGADFSASSIDGPLDYLETYTRVRASAERVPAHGVRASLTYNVFDRCFERGVAEIAPVFRYVLDSAPFNHRIGVDAGYQFRPGAWFTFGASFDIDGDTFYTNRDGPTRFDGAYGRIVVVY